MKLLSSFIIVTFLLFISCQSRKNSHHDLHWEMYVSAEEAGFSTEKLNIAKAYYDSIGSDAVFVVYKGNVLINWGETHRRFACHSVRKSLMSMIYGIYIDNATIDTNKTLQELGIDDYPYYLTQQEKKARVADLLSARSGIYLPAAAEPIRNRKPERGSYEPGTNWCYNNWDFNALLTILEQESGKNFKKIFYEDLAAPLQLQDYHTNHLDYHYEPEKSKHPAYLFRLSARDMARLGLLYLNKGNWFGKQIISEEYIKISTSRISNKGWGNTGYGYMWWIHNDSPFDSLGMYSALGTGEQSIDIIPKADIVFVNRSNTYKKERITWQQRRKLIRLILEAKVSDMNLKPKLKKLPEHVKPIYLPLSDDDKVIAGEYTNDEMNLIIYFQDSLIMTDFGKGNYPLLKTNKNEFLVEDFEAVLEFEKDNNQVQYIKYYSYVNCKNYSILKMKSE